MPLRGSFSKRSTARRVNGSLSLSTILYMRQPHTTQLQRRLLLLHLNGICRWTLQLLLRGSFSKRSNRSTGHFYFHYIIYDSRRRQAHTTTPLQKAHRVNGSTGQTGRSLPKQERALVAFKPRPILFIMNKICLNQTGRRVNGSLSLSLYYIG